MRFMLLMHPGLESEADWEPQPDDVEAMMGYNEELTKAGVLLALDGLHPPSKGARVSFSGGKATVSDIPAQAIKDVIGGYWVIQVGSKDEAIDWASRCPVLSDQYIEVRRVFDMEDFPEDVQAAAGELSQEPPQQPVER